MKTKSFVCSLLILTALIVSLPIARAQQEIFTATMTGSQEAMPNNSTGTGFAIVTLDLAMFTMRVQVIFAGLSSGTLASHIHAPTAMAFTGTASVATTTPTFANFPLGVTTGTYDNTLDLTQASSFNPAFVTANGGSVTNAANALISAIEDGKAYLNIHTTNFPSGEIRGFLTAAVPEPASVSLLTIGSAALGYGIYRRRRR